MDRGGASKGERSTTGQGKERGAPGQMERGKNGASQGQMERGKSGTSGQGMEREPQRGTTQKDSDTQRGATSKDKDGDRQRGATSKDKDSDRQRGATSKDKDSDTQRGAATKGGGGAGSASLSTEQRTKIKQTVLRGGNAPKVSRSEINFNISVGTVVPRDRVRLVTVPATIVEIHPAWRGYLYFVVEEEIIIVEPGSLRIVAVIA
jgi:hypothetical protein